MVVFKCFPLKVSIASNTGFRPNPNWLSVFVDVAQPRRETQNKTKRRRNLGLGPKRVLLHVLS